jgi:SAM-dependent methyltransferase
MVDKKILDLGCGNRKFPGSIGVDQIAIPGVDVVHNLNTFPYPFEKSQFDRIILKHVAEHVDDVVSLMEEVHRLAKPGGVVEIHVPHFSSANAYSDPTHKHYFSLLVFDFFCGVTVHDYLLKMRYRLLKRSVTFWALHDRFPWLSYRLLGLGWLAENHTIFYERFLTFLFPLQEFTVELEILK